MKNLSPEGTGDPAPPALLQGSDLANGDIGSFAWDPAAASDSLSFTDYDLTVWWDTNWSEGREGAKAPAWLGAPTQLQLHSGHFAWDFVVEEMGSAQIGVGVMLLWDVGPDWGFFGYLGSSSTAWSYDPSTCFTTFGGRPHGPRTHSWEEWSFARIVVALRQTANRSGD